MFTRKMGKPKKKCMLGELKVQGRTKAHKWKSKNKDGTYHPRWLWSPPTPQCNSLLMGRFVLLVWLGGWLFATYVARLHAFFPIHWSIFSRQKHRCANIGDRWYWNRCWSLLLFLWFLQILNTTQLISTCVLCLGSQKEQRRREKGERKRMSFKTNWRMSWAAKLTWLIPHHPILFCVLCLDPICLPKSAKTLQLQASTASSHHTGNDRSYDLFSFQN